MGGKEGKREAVDQRGNPEHGHANFWAARRASIGPVCVHGSNNTSSYLFSRPLPVLFSTSSSHLASTSVALLIDQHYERPEPRVRTFRFFVCICTHVTFRRRRRRRLAIRALPHASV